MAQKAQPHVQIKLTGKESDEAVQKLLKSAQKTSPNVVVKLNEDADEDEAKAADITPNLPEMAVRGIDVGLQGMATLPNVPATIERHFEANAAQLTTPNWLLAGLLLIVAALLGLTANWLVSLALPDRTAAFTEPMPLSKRLFASTKRVIGDVIGVLVFLKAAHVLDHLFLHAQAEQISSLFETIVTRIIIILFYVAGARFLLKPYANGQRLIPLPNADRYKWLLIIYGVIGPAVLIGDDFLKWSGASRDERSGWFMLGGTIVVLFKAWFFWHGRHDLAQLIRSGAPFNRPPGVLRQTFATLAGPIFACTSILIWLLGRISAVAPRGGSWGEAAALTQFYVVLSPLIATGAAQLLHGWMTRQKADAPPTPLRIALRDTAAMAAGATIWLIAIADLGRVWAHFLNTVIGQTGVSILQGVVAAAATAIVGVLIWLFLKRLFEEYLPKKRSALPGADDDLEETEPTIQSRLSSVLPVLRGIALALVFAITLLVVLNRLGIDTGPLLAGFGIAGLALSFGSQALVRDVVSGIFFLADDAFRVGEYIDTGKLKGTVERITLRSVQLRHQSGLVHTIPYGQLQAVTNASRDWATVKFTIRLDRDADIEKARKIIKKIGQELLEHAEFGEDFINPVKMQGISDIQDNALVARIKFTAKPFRTSQIQREALKRIYLKLIEAGVPLATTEVRVRGGSHEAAAAAFAAATPSTVQPSGG